MNIEALVHREGAENAEGRREIARQWFLVLRPSPFLRAPCLLCTFAVKNTAKTALYCEPDYFTRRTAAFILPKAR